MIKDKEILILTEEDGAFSTMVGPISQDIILEIIKSKPDIADISVQKIKNNNEKIEKINEDLASLYIEKELTPFYDTIDNAEGFQWLVKTQVWEDFIENISNDT